MVVILVVSGLIDIGIIFSIVYPFMHDNPMETWIEYFIYLITLVGLGKFYGIYSIFQKSINEFSKDPLFLSPEAFPCYKVDWKTKNYRSVNHYLLLLALLAFILFILSIIAGFV